MVSDTSLGNRIFWMRPARCLAVALPICALLYGCSDDGLGARNASTVASHDGRSAPSRKALKRSSTDAAASAPVAGANGNERYFLSVGKVVLRNHAGSDWLSHPDIYVVVQRRDPVILEAIDRQGNRLSDLMDRKKSVAELLKPLRLKKRRSEIVPGEPLSSKRLRRLADLSRTTEGQCNELLKSNSCNKCGRYDEKPICSRCEDCKELQFLLKKKAESEIVPGPPLSTPEKEALATLELEKRDVQKNIETGRRKLKKLRNGITGHTNTVTTSGYTLDYGFVPIQEIFPGDEVLIAVYDRDIGEDDLYGSIVFPIQESFLKGEDLVVRSIQNVRSVTLRIVSR